jgi:hypothetical protein
MAANVGKTIFLEIKNSKSRLKIAAKRLQKNFCPNCLFFLCQPAYLRETFSGSPDYVLPASYCSPKLRLMNITFEELRRIKHALPTGSIQRIAKELNIEEQTVRNYFGAHNYTDGQVVEWHLEPGPGGGIVHLEDTTILDRALQIIEEYKVSLQ